MSDKTDEGRSGGINFGGPTSISGGQIAGRDVNSGPAIPPAALDDLFGPVLAAIKNAPGPTQTEAEQKLNDLKQEAAKGKEKADDRVMAKLIDGLVDLVPAAATAVGSVFATPLLSALVGPAASYVIDRIRGK